MSIYTDQGWNYYKILDIKSEFGALYYVGKMIVMYYALYNLIDCTEV